SSNAVSADRQRPTNGGKPSGATRPLGHLLLRPSRDVPRRLCSGGRPARRHIGQVVTGIGFEIITRDGAARLGRLSTAHGLVETPVFMPGGTAATVKAMTPEGVAASGARLIPGNTYHPMLRPGAERIAAPGGLHRFMNCPYAILTSSGAVEGMSLLHLRKLDEER